MPVTTIQITPINWEIEIPELILSMMLTNRIWSASRGHQRRCELLELGIVQAIALVLFALQAAGEKQ